MIVKANPGVENTVPYQAGLAIEELKRSFGVNDEIIKLASNENPLGASPKALESAKQALANSLGLYPDASYLRLRQAIADYNDVVVDNVTVGNGSENCLELLCKTFLNSTKEALVDEYCFATIQILVRGYGAKLVKIPSVDYVHDIKATINAVSNNTQMIFIVNPNNPTGTYVSHDDLIYILDNVPMHVVVVVDEAYFEYADAPDFPRAIPLIKRYPNLVITRTYSKVFGLAGIRLGYTISSIEIAQLLHKARLPFNVNIVAVEAGIAALSDSEFLAKTVELNTEGKKQLQAGFSKLGLSVIPSQGNFLTVKAPGALKVYEGLLRLGIIVRPLVPYGLNEYLRITIGTYEQNSKLLQKLAEVI